MVFTISWNLLLANRIWKSSSPRSSFDWLFFVLFWIIKEKNGPTKSIYFGTWGWSAGRPMREHFCYRFLFFLQSIFRFSLSFVRFARIIFSSAHIFDQSFSFRCLFGWRSHMIEKSNVIGILVRFAYTVPFLFVRIYMYMCNVYRTCGCHVRNVYFRFMCDGGQSTIQYNHRHAHTHTRTYTQSLTLLYN